ncbi:MAG: hypothetical protein R3321_09870 [Nitrososphaeraceae archaeon]|nr:hypothetical protein [Nitrososphaeraceae archaeon]
MSLEEKIFQQILSSGVEGVKKTILKKEYPDIDIDKNLDSWINSGEIIISKKANTFYCWHKDNYFQYLINSDPKFKYVYDYLKDLRDSFQTFSTTVDKQVEKLDSRLILLMDSLLNNNSVKHEASSPSHPKGALDIDTFKHDFDLSISKHSGSSGWVELLTIKNELCLKYQITDSHFYNYVEQLVNHFNEDYELSSGGDEGIVIRGLLHGFVRCL